MTLSSHVEITLSPPHKNDKVYKFGHYFNDFGLKICLNKKLMYCKIIDLFKLYNFHINFIFI
jgi:hypothetical protein